MTALPSTSPSRLDADLLREFAERRDESAFAEIVERHGGMVLSVCRSVLGNGGDAEDAAQAVFVTLAVKSSSRGVRASLVGWLHRVAWYVAARASQAREIRRRHEKEAARMKSDLLEAQDSAIPAEALHGALAALPDRHRIPLILHHLEGRSQEETAALLGCSVSACGMRLNRARRALGARLARRGVMAPAEAFSGVVISAAMTHFSPGFVSAASRAATAAMGGKLAATGVISAKTMALSKGALHMLYWSKVKLASLVVLVLVMAGGGAYVVAATSGAAQIAGGGTITAATATSVTINRNGQDTTVTIDGNTVITIDGVTKTAADLKTGLYAGAWGSGTNATEIRAYTPKPATTGPSPASGAALIAGGGLITGVTADSVTITRGGNAVTVTVTASTVVTVDNKTATLADLKTGQYAGAWGTGQAASQIKAFTRTSK